MKINRSRVSRQAWCSGRFWPHCPTFTWCRHGAATSSSSTWSRCTSSSSWSSAASRTASTSPTRCSTSWAPSCPCRSRSWAFSRSAQASTWPLRAHSLSSRPTVSWTTCAPSYPRPSSDSSLSLRSLWPLVLCLLALLRSPMPDMFSRGAVVSTLSGILATPRFTFRSLLVSVSISPPRGPRSSLICTCLSAFSPPVSGSVSRSSTTRESSVSWNHIKNKWSYARYYTKILIVFFLVVLYAVFASYFAGVMVRLILTLTPVVCVLAAIAFSK